MKNILCYIYEGFVDYEISLASGELNLTDRFNLIYIAYEKTPIKSAAGMSINPDYTVREAIDISDVEGLIIPGGVVRVLKSELESLILKLYNEEKLIAAICGGPEFLAKIGLLNSKKYATSMYPQDYEEKNEKDPFPRETYTDDRIALDGNLLTAKGHAFVDFALEVWDWFKIYDYDGEKEDSKKFFSPL